MSLTTTRTCKNCKEKINIALENLNSGDYRPINVNKGTSFFDNTVNKPIWWTGTKWVDATGADV